MSKVESKPFATRNKVFSVFLATSILLITSAFPLPSPAKDGAQLATEGLSFFQKRRYAEAFKLLSQAEKTRSIDPSLQYYLGVSALYSGNQAIAKRALSRCVVMSLPNNPFHKQSLALLHQHFRVQPYCCRARAIKSHSWSKKTMPINIYISDGKMLPPDYRKPELSQPQMAQVSKWAKLPGFVSRLESTPGFRSAQKQAVRSGAQWWSWASGEGILSYQFVQDPAKANILVFFYPTNQARHQLGVTNGDIVATNAIVIQMFVDTGEFAGQGGRNPDVGLEKVAAHEFGHSWGLDHSTDKADLMYSMGTEATAATENDKQTLRALYAGPTELMRIPLGK